MNSSIENFVGVFEDVFSKEYCDRVIQYFEDTHAAGFSYTRQQEREDTLKTDKDDTVVWGDMSHSNLLGAFNNVFWACYEVHIITMLGKCKKLKLVRAIINGITNLILENTVLGY